MAVKTMNEKGDPREVVPFHLPYKKGSKGEFVSVNHHNYFVPRGKTVEIPRFIAQVLENSLEQDQRTAEMVEELNRSAE